MPEKEPISSNTRRISPYLNSGINQLHQRERHHGGGGKIKKNDDHIKKPLNAFMWFMKENRKKLLDEIGNNEKQSAELNKELGNRWHDLPKEEQQKYFDLAKKDREDHKQKYPQWSARENYAVNKKNEKKMRDKSIASVSENGDEKKCRARFGVNNQKMWCKFCKRKKKCEYSIDRNTDTMMMDMQDRGLIMPEKEPISSNTRRISPYLNSGINQLHQRERHHGGGGKIKKNDDHIKKPLNAFMWFMKENRKKLLDEIGNNEKQSAELNKELGNRWHDLPKEEQQKYFDLAKKDREDHKQKYPQWSARENYAVNKKNEKKMRDKSIASESSTWRNSDTMTTDEKMEEIDMNWNNLPRNAWLLILRYLSPTERLRIGFLNRKRLFEILEIAEINKLIVSKTNAGYFIYVGWTNTELTVFIREETNRSHLSFVFPEGSIDLETGRTAEMVTSTLTKDLTLNSRTTLTYLQINVFLPISLNENMLYFPNLRHLGYEGNEPIGMLLAILNGSPLIEIISFKSDYDFSDPFPMVHTQRSRCWYMELNGICRADVITVLSSIRVLIIAVIGIEEPADDLQDLVEVFCNKRFFLLWASAKYQTSQIITMMTSSFIIICAWELPSRRGLGVLLQAFERNSNLCSFLRITNLDQNQIHYLFPNISNRSGNLIFAHHLGDFVVEIRYYPSDGVMDITLKYLPRTRYDLSDSEEESVEDDESEPDSETSRSQSYIPMQVDSPTTDQTPVQIGGLAPLSGQDYPATVPRSGLNGCIRNLYVNGDQYDLATPAYETNSEKGCRLWGSTCDSNSIDSLNHCVHGDCYADIQGSTAMVAKCICDPGWGGSRCEKKVEWVQFSSGGFIEYSPKVAFNEQVNEIDLLFIAGKVGGSAELTYGTDSQQSYVSTNLESSSNGISPAAKFDIGSGGQRAQHDLRVSEVLLKENASYWMQFRRNPTKASLSIDGAYSVSELIPNGQPYSLQVNQIMLGTQGQGKGFQGCIGTYRWSKQNMPLKRGASLDENEESMVSISNSGGVQDGCDLRITCAHLPVGYKFTTCDAGCQTLNSADYDGIVISANSTVVVGVNATSRDDCTCPIWRAPPGCQHSLCHNDGICHNTSHGFFCECRNDALKGSRCQGTTRSFGGNGFAWYKPMPACTSLNISFSFMTTQSDALLFYNGPMDIDTTGTHIEYSDYIFIQLRGGRVSLEVSMNGQILSNLEVASSALNDGTRHEISVNQEGKRVELVVDSCRFLGAGADESSCRADVYTPDDDGRLNIVTPVQIGGLAPLSGQDYPATVPRSGLNGCIRNLYVNGDQYDLATPAYETNSEKGCRLWGSTCDSNSIDSLNHCVHGDCYADIQGSTAMVAKCICDPGWGGSRCEKKVEWVQFSSGGFIEYSPKVAFNEQVNEIDLLFIAGKVGGSAELTYGTDSQQSYVSTNLESSSNGISPAAKFDIGSGGQRAQHDLRVSEVLLKENASYWMQFRKNPTKASLSIDGAYSVSELIPNGQPYSLQVNQIMLGTQGQGKGFQGCIGTYRWSKQNMPLKRGASLDENEESMVSISNSGGVQDGCDLRITCAHLPVGYKFTTCDAGCQTLNSADYDGIVISANSTVVVGVKASNL